MNQDPARVLPGEITKIDQFLMVLTFRLANGRWKNRIANDGIFYLICICPVKKYSNERFSVSKMPGSDSGYFII